MRLPFRMSRADHKIFSFMGMGPKKTWDAVSTSAYELDPATGKWTEKRPVPGVAGRLAASAVALHDQVFIFGGYVVDSQGGETTVSDLNVFVPIENRYYRGKDIPVPVADAVVGLLSRPLHFSHRRMVGSSWIKRRGRHQCPDLRHRQRHLDAGHARSPAHPCSVMPAPSSATPSFTWMALTRTPSAQSQVSSRPANAGWA